MNSEKKTYINLVKAKPEIFDAPAHYQFILVGKIKIETVDSFLNRGGTITYVGRFSDPLHSTNYPGHELEDPSSIRLEFIENQVA